MAMADDNPEICVAVYLFDDHGNWLPFHLTFFGIPMRYFTSVPCQAQKHIEAALKRHRLTNVHTSPFAVREKIV